MWTYSEITEQQVRLCVLGVDFAKFADYINSGGLESEIISIWIQSFWKSDKVLDLAILEFVPCEVQL